MLKCKLLRIGFFKSNGMKDEYELYRDTREMSLEWTHPINNQHEYYNLLESLQHCCFVACRSWDLCSEFDNEWRDNIIYARVRDVKLEQKSPKLYKVVHVMTADEHSGSVRGNFPTGRLVSSCHLTWNSECDVKHM